MNNKDKSRIWELFFDKVKDITEIEAIMGGEYTYNEIRKIIWERYK